MRSLCLAGLLLVGATGPFDIPLRNTAKAPDAKGTARLVYSASPFGVAVTADGIASFDVRLDLSGLPDPSSLGEYSTFIAWATTTTLSEWRRLGTVRNGVSTVGRVTWNKFLLVVTAEADSLADTRTGPTVIHGPSPSTWLQSFLTHPMFKGIPPG